MTSLPDALLLSFVMGAVILFCRAFPFLFFPGGKPLSTEQPPQSGAAAKEASRGAKAARAFLNFVEKTVPPAAMAVLAFNALGTPFLENPRDGLLALAASVFTAAVHLWKRNSLISIFGGTALYMILTRLLSG